MIWIENGDGRGAEPVTRAEAKNFLRLDNDGEDAIVDHLIAAAREGVERFTGLVLRRGRFRLAFEPAAGERRIRLARRPVRAVLAATAFGRDGAPQPFPASGFRVREDAVRERVDLAEGFAQAAVNGAELEIEAGLEPAEVPAPVKLAILRLVVASFELRGAVAADLQPAVMPAHVRGLLQPYRAVGV